MELDSDVGSQKNKGIFSDGILGLLTELHIERGGQEINAGINGKFLSADKLSIVFGSQRQARIESYISGREHCPAWCYQACTRGQSLAWCYNSPDHQPHFVFVLCHCWKRPQSGRHQESDQPLDLVLLCFRP